MSGLPYEKPNVFNPILSYAILPAKINKSAQLILLPYFFLIGHNNLLALSKLVLSGQEFKGANLKLPVPAPPLPSEVLYVPAACHAILIINPP